MGPAASTTLAAVVMGVAFCLGPMAVVVAVITAVVVAKRDDMHWHELAGYGAACLGAVLVAVLLMGQNLFDVVFASTWHWLTHPTLWPPSLLADFVPSLAVWAPAGVTLGACLFGTAENRALGAEWHPLEMRFRRIEKNRELERIAEAAADVNEQNACASPPLGVSYDDGDLDELRDAAYVTLAPLIRRCIGMAVVGAAGSGKTETIKRIIAIAAWLDFSVILGDWKGDDALTDEAFAAFLSWRSTPRVVVHAFPEEPVNGWLGLPAQLTSRLLGVFEWNEPYYESATRSLIDWFVAGGCGSSSEFLSRMTLGYLRKQAGQDPSAAAEFEALKNNRNILDGARLRFAGFFRGLDGAYDGVRSWSDSHIFVISIKSLAARADAEAQVRMLLNDIMQWATDPERRAQGGKYLVVLDEFSEMAEVAAELVISMAEKLRSAGVLIIVAAQSYEGLGIDDQQRDRLLAALAGGVILHRCQTPERLCELAGTVRLPEQSWQLDATTHSGMGSMREGYRMKLLPDDVRQARTGEAWLISHGRVSHLQVLQAETSAKFSEAQRLHEESRLRGQALRRRRVEAPRQPPGIEAPSFLDEL